MKNTALASLAALYVASLDHIVEIAKLVALLAPVVVGVIQALRRPPRREHKPKKVKVNVLPPVACALLLATAGCSTTNVSEMVKALGSDTNSVTISVRSPWGTVDVKRN
jgi:uncharacterized protein (UPF0371 family)